MFKDSFKYYKARKPPPDLSNVLDMYKVDEINVNKIRKIDIKYSDTYFGLIAPNNWEVYELIENPGLIYIKNPFTKQGLRYWTIRCLRDYTKKPNKLNIDIHNLIPKGTDWWEYSLENKEVVKPMRWATLGYHHDWETKVYAEDSKAEFPKDLKCFCAYLGDALGFENFNAEAAIVNFYHLDSTLSGHTDHSELNLDAPLFSFSFGNTAIFLIGGKTIEEKPSAIFLQNGDITIMSRESRLSYHGVPKILPSITTTTNSDITGYVNQPEINDVLVSECMNEDYWKAYDNYLRTSRINLNVRQVLIRGQNRICNE